MNLLAQAIGIVGLIFIVLSFQHKTRRGILAFIFIGCLLFAVHFSLIGAMTGAILNVLTALQALLFSRYENKRRPLWPLLFMITSYGFAAVITWQGFISLLPMIGTMIGAISYWQRKPQHVRIGSLAARPFWFVYNLVSGSIGGVVSELLSSTSILVGLWRYRKRGITGAKTVQNTP